ncbi:MAG: alpha/beta hydrolase, partial [Inhella sp.]
MSSRRHLLGLLASAPLLVQARAPSVHDPARLLVLGPLPMPGLDRERSVRVYLPPSYVQQAERRYPVIYFHDGQNLFDDATSYAGEWGADELLDRLAPQGLEAIAVGVDNGGARRMTELNPWDHPRFGKGEGWGYLRFLVEVLKPTIDGRFRTKAQAA